MIDKECLKLSLSEYFSYCQKKPIRGLALITDKQYIFYSQINNDCLIHNDIAIILENQIHPHYKIYSIDAIRSSHIVIFSLGQELFIELSRTGEISLSQYLFLEEILKDIEKLNSNNKIGIVIVNNHIVYDEEYNTDINLVLSYLNNLISKNILIEKEKIIGKTLNNEIVIKTMKYNIDIENCTSLSDLLNAIKTCDKYYSDNYYSKFLKEIFPSYFKVKELFSKIFRISNENFTLDNITYNNIQEKLQKLYNSLIKIKKR